MRGRGRVHKIERGGKKKKKMAIWVPSKLMSLERWLPTSVSSDSMPAGGVVVAAAQARGWEKRSVAWLVAVNCVPLGQLNPENSHRQIDDTEVLKENEEVS